MSALGGIYYFDNRPVDRPSLISLGEKLSSHGPDGGSEIISGSIGMVYRAYHTNRESRLEKQPLVSREGHTLAWDGRLDNREEMISLLRQELNGDRTDVAIAMAAYLKFGSDFLPRLIGDFALSLWEPRTRTLLLARDAVGPRTLYYHANDNRIIWSTELGILLDLAGIKLEINDEYIADFLTRLPDPAQTPYKNVHAVPPGNVVTARNGQVRAQRFWGLDPKQEIRYKTDAEYEEHFLHLFREAVRCRLRADGPVWAELSGGLDSSSIVCMADQLIKSGDAQAPALQTVSYVFDEAAKSDERKYIHYVEEKIGQKGLYLREDDYRMLAPLPDGYVPVIPNPVANFAAYNCALDTALRESGARTLLSGKGGDEILSSMKDPAPELADLLVRWRLLQLHRRLLVWSQTLKRPYYRLLWQQTISPILPRKFQAIFQDGYRTEILDLHDRDFIKRMHLRERRLGISDIFGFHYPSGRDQAGWFLRAVRELAAGFWREFVKAEISYPFMHRPLVEFMQAVPFDQRVRTNETRSILRRALRNVLPEGIANRKGKTLNTDAALRAVVREWPRLHKMLAEARVCAHGYVNREALLMALERGKSGSDASSLSIVFPIVLEHWLCAIERQGVTAPQSAVAMELKEARARAY
jgi:asparagine synthase (glutamine-hydrolysing)